ncbi:MAG: hypothetical protein U1E65_35895 [Myxococcota bacterium]
MARACAVFLALLLGCSPELRRLELPVGDEASLLVLSLGARPAATAFDFMAERPGRLDLPEIDGDRVYLLRYRCPLSALGLQAGPLRLGEGLPLPETSAVLGSTITRGAPLEFSALRAVPEELLAVRAVRSPPSPCVSFQSTPYPLTQHVFDAALFGADQLMLAYASMWEVYQLPGMTRVGTGSTIAPHPPGLAVDAGGTAYIARMSGEITVVSPNLETRTIAAETGTTAFDHEGVRLETNAPGKSERLWMVNALGRVDVFDGTRWRERYHHLGPQGVSDPAIVRRAPDEFLVTGPEAQDLLSFGPGEQTRRTHVVPDGVSAGISAIFLDEVRGVVLFTEDGRLLIEQGGRYHEHGLRGIAQRSVSTVAPIAGGLLAAGHAGGVVVQYDFEAGECPSPIPVAIARILRILRWRDTWVVIGNGDTDGAVAILVPDALPPRCDSGSFPG